MAVGIPRKMDLERVIDAQDFCPHAPTPPHELWYGMDERHYEHSCDKVESKITFNNQEIAQNLYASQIVFSQ